MSSALKPIGDGYVLPLLGTRTSIGYDLATSSFPAAWEVKRAESPGPKGEGTDAIYQSVEITSSHQVSDGGSMAGFAGLGQTSYLK